MSGNPGPDPIESIDRTRLREAQINLINEINELLLNRSETLAEILQLIVDRTRQILDAPRVNILIAYPDGLRSEISSDIEDVGYFVPLDNSFHGSVLQEQQPILVHNIQNDPAYRESYYPRAGAAPTYDMPTVSVLATGITLEHLVVGVVSAEAPAYSFDGSHVEFLATVARHISLAITHATLFDEDALQIATDNLLMAGTTPGTGTSDNEWIMHEVLDAILERLYSLAFLKNKVEAAEILLADPQDDRALIVASSKNDADIGIKVDIASSVCGDAYRTGRTMLLARAAEEYMDYRPIIAGMRCEMAIPISLGGSQQFPIGVLNLESSMENAFSNVGRVLAERFARRIANIVAMTKLRVDIDNEQADQLQILAADQVLNAVHRINNHVGSIRAIVQELRADLESANPVDLAELKRGLGQISMGAEKALEIPGELKRRISAPRQSADVNAQVAAGIERIRMPKTVSLTSDLALWLPDIPCTGLDLAVENLLTNAVKAQSTEVRVATSIDQRLPREPFVVVTVSDNGVGMTQQQVARLFEPKQSSREGHGLGFSMPWTRGWVRRSGGLINVDSRPGEGTTVSMRFQFDPLLFHRAPEGIL